MSIIKKTAVVLIIAALLFTSARSLAVPDMSIQAEAALLVELESGTILYGKAENARRAPDGLTKIMTLLLIVEACERGELDTSEVIAMSDTALQDANAAGRGMIKAEEEMTLLDIMYCSYLGSSDEACSLIAQRLRGTTASFVTAMNDRAKELGCVNTNFTNVYGRADDGQYTSAWDMYLIYSAAMQSPLFAEISAAVKYKTEGTNISAERTLTNPNYLLSESSRYYYRYCTGGRPSATYESGYNLVASAEREGLCFVSVVLGAQAVILEDESTQMQNLSETRRLFEWGFENYSWRDILSPGELVAKVPVRFGDGADFVNLRPASAITVLTANDVSNEVFQRSITIYAERDGTGLTAPVAAGDILGEITLTRSGELCGTVKLVANTGVGLRQTEYIKARIGDALRSRTTWLIIAGVILLFAGYIVLLVRYSLKRRERMRRIREAKRQLAEERSRQQQEEQREVFRN